MESAFLIVVFVVGVLGVVAAVVSVFVGQGHEQIGRGGLSLDTPDRPSAPPPGSAAAQAEQEAEVRQLVEAKSARRQARGEAPLDVEAEVAALLRPSSGAVDEGLRDEVRQLVIARNERRSARGQPPLDVETEDERQLRDLGA